MLCPRCHGRGALAFAEVPGRELHARCYACQGEGRVVAGQAS
jgi:DnaJ-class molecular chaperone